MIDFFIPFKGELTKWDTRKSIGIERKNKTRYNWCKDKYKDYSYITLDNKSCYFFQIHFGFLYATVTAENAKISNVIIIVTAITAAFGHC